MTVTKVDLEQEIIGLFDSDITISLSINQISKKLGKAYPYINKKVSEFISEGILKKIPVGRSYLCSINLASEKAVLLLTLNELEKKSRFQQKNKGFDLNIFSELRSAFKIYSIFHSDGRTYFVLDYLNDKDAILNRFPGIKSLNPEFIGKGELRKGLLENKRMLTEKTVLYAFEKYYELLHEIEGDLIIKYSPLFSSALKKTSARSSEKKILPRKTLPAD